MTLSQAPPSANRPLARLERVELRSVWQEKSIHFTPWLAQDENIALLASHKKMCSVFNPLVTTLDASDYTLLDVVPTPAVDGGG